MSLFWLDRYTDLQSSYFRHWTDHENASWRALLKNQIINTTSSHSFLRPITSRQRGERQTVLIPFPASSSLTPFAWCSIFNLDSFQTEKHLEKVNIIDPFIMSKFSFCHNGLPFSASFPYFCLNVFKVIYCWFSVCGKGLKELHSRHFLKMS